MIFIRTAAALLIAMTSLSACATSTTTPGGEGTVTLTPEVGQFTALTVGSAFTAVTRRGANPGVQITVPAPLQDRVVVRTTGQTLEITLQPGPGSLGQQAMMATVTVGEPLAEVTAQQAASVDATASGTLAGDARLRAQEASTVTATVNASKLTVEASEGSTVTASGQADTAEVISRAGSTFRGFDLQSRAVTATVAEGSTAEVTATATLTGSVSAGSTMRYRGSPQTSVDTDVSSTLERDSA